MVEGEIQRYAKAIMQDVDNMLDALHKGHNILGYAHSIKEKAGHIKAIAIKLKHIEEKEL